MNDEDIIEAIRDGTITEGQDCDFKAKLDFSDKKVKNDIVADVSAFLNSGSARMFIGVKEDKNNGFEKFEPYTGNADDLCRQVTSIIQDGIDPKPLRVVVREIGVEGGFILEITIPEHLLRPYQHKAAGAFFMSKMVRTGRQNAPIPRDQVKALFTTRERYNEDAKMLMQTTVQAMREIDPAPPSDALSLEIGIVPGEHYAQRRSSFSGRRGRIELVSFRHYHGWHGGTFNPCDDGMESLQTDGHGRPICRLFVSSDWLVHSFVAWPFHCTKGEGRLTVSEFRVLLSNHLKTISEFLEEQEVLGPYGVICRIEGLHRSEKIKWAYPRANSVRMPPQWLERVDDPGLIEGFYTMVAGDR